MTTNTAATQDQSHLDTGRTASVALHFVTLRKQEICQNFIIMKSAYMILTISEVFSDLFLHIATLQHRDLILLYMIKGCPNDSILAMLVPSAVVTHMFKY